ncbi:glycosyltransferase family 2 protein [Parabacteroides sp. FAFU027]|uniref:glycosyltransferase family 2 protein n=1 Tax=Parabacteroides sp. FAFU027 TaxID=2922715 RepID=UPI001FAE8247|nr:glycosyltransferase family A protein [Parabacteroides sp. FAFU027]
MNKIDCFIPLGEAAQTLKTLDYLRDSGVVNNIFLLSTNAEFTLPGYETIVIDSLQSSDTVAKIEAKSKAEYILIYSKTSILGLGYFALERMVKIAEESGAGLLYSDYNEVKLGRVHPVPLIDCQEGSVRDDFNFGSLILYKTEAIRQAVTKTETSYKHAGLYNLRLKISQQWPLVHLNEYLYTEVELDERVSGEKQFDYVDPRNRAVQIEMEEACTDHLKKTGVWLKPEFKAVSFNQQEFEFEASVIIPVRNRVNTIKDAVKSALSQKTNFPFNVIVIDNHSTDGTSDVIEEFKMDHRLIHIIPERLNLGIGGCWNEGVHHPQCGKFAVQLDSDDIYSSPQTLQTVVDAFYDQNCAMVVGTYRMTNFALEEIPPGIIDHREWTPENGRNNALRINGLGAPRAFYTPMLREIKVPNTSYGEDYALGLNFSREYQIGRIYDVLYLCRRWEGNSDAALDVHKLNANNLYKDKIRTIEMAARKRLNQKQN